MRVLIIFYKPPGFHRSTINEHLNAFRNYSDANIFYLNIYFGVPVFIERIQFELIIYHYTFLSEKFHGPQHFSEFLKKSHRLKYLKGYKIAMPQDEYVYSNLICDFFKNFQISKVYTCFYPEDWPKAYPKDKTGPIELETCLTGYIDEISFQKLSLKILPHKLRTIDVGYRARKVPFWLGEHGTIKWKITEAVKSLSTRFKDLKFNVSNSEKDVFNGSRWYDFLLNCRTVLGCEGGASLHDPDGLLKLKVDLYTKENPNAEFEEVKDLFFKDQDNNISLFAISPRHFEACLTKTCQILVEGNYHGIFVPWVHYMPLKRDFSNLEDILDKVRDTTFCERIAENAYRDIIKSGNFTYRNFIKKVFSNVPVGSTKLFSERVFWLLSRLHYQFLAIKGLLHRLLSAFIRRLKLLN